MNPVHLRYATHLILSSIPAVAFQETGPLSKLCWAAPVQLELPRIDTTLEAHETWPSYRRKFLHFSYQEKWKKHSNQMLAEM